MPTDPNTVNLIWICTMILLPIIPAYILYKTLPAKTAVSGPFQGLRIDLSGAFAGYFLLVIVIVTFGRPVKADLTYEVWTVKGKIEDEDGGVLPRDKINLNLQPRSVEYLDDGAFEMDILVRRGQSGQVKFPTLLVERQPAQAFGNETVHLDSSMEKLGKKYARDINKESREITITDPIKLKKLAEKPYAPPAAAPNPTVLPQPTQPSP